MLYRLAWSIEDKSWTRKLHNLANLFSPYWLIAMDLTIRAKGLIRTMRARRKFTFDISLKITNLTIRKAIILPMKQINHITNNLIFFIKLLIHKSLLCANTILDISILAFLICRLD